MGISEEVKKKYKSMGYVPNREGDTVSARIVTKNGVLSIIQTQALSSVAQKYGNGKITITSRLGIELPGIAYDDIQNVADELAKADLYAGGTGAKVRPVTACKGTVCPHGNADTQALALEIHKRFYDGYRKVNLPHKFKIGVGGCPNNCIKPDINDLGIVALNSPRFDFDKCVECADCLVEPKCPMKTFAKKTGPDAGACTKCGECVGKCPYGVADNAQKCFKIYLGGKWGKVVRMGSLMSEYVYSKEELFNLIEKILLLYIEEGKPKERFGVIVDRLGMDKVEKKLKSNDLLDRKIQILEKNAQC
jgi:dissimilatory sulfite reductase (desulfoviridin) alpha/beta subunit